MQSKKYLCFSECISSFIQNVIVHLLCAKHYLGARDTKIIKSSKGKVRNKSLCHLFPRNHLDRLAGQG